MEREIEITQAMLDAGATAVVEMICADHGEHFRPDHLARDVFKAMIAARDEP